MIKNLFRMAEELYVDFVKSHIRLLTLDYTKYKATQKIYESMFDDFHDIGEKMEQTDYPISSDDDCEMIISDLYEKNEEYKENLKEAIEEEDDEAVKNLFINLYDKAQLNCSILKSPMQKHKNEDKDEYKD